MHSSDPGLEAFLAEHVSWVFGLATVLTSRRVDAEDVAQEVLVRVMKNQARVRGADNPKAYLRRMIVNEVIRFDKRARRDSSVTLVDRGLEEQGFGQADIRADTPRLLAGLSRRQAAAIALYYLDGCSQMEIAAALGCRAGTVRSLISRGLAEIREKGFYSDGDGAAADGWARRGATGS